ncbi:MAG: ABC transporter permease [Thermoanaerobaculia bacterium]|nr:ABC transporter permease [Thermoanaerobaculia bacterium]
MRPPPLAWQLAPRFVKSTRRDAATSFLSAVAAAGIALGVAALVLALSALAGLQRALRAEILDRTPQLEIELPAGSDTGELLRAVEKVEGVRFAQALARSRGWLVAGGTAREVEVVAYADRLPRSFPGARTEEAGAGLVLGEELADDLRVRPGDRVELVGTRPTLTPLGPQPRIRALPVAGTFHSGRTERGDRVALPLALADGLLRPGPPLLEVATGSLEEALPLAGRLREVLPAGSAVRTWQDLNRPLFFALHLERAVMFAAVSLIVVVAALVLVADLALLQASRWRELGALAAMGAAPRELGRLFTLLGVIVGGGGAAAGACVGAVAALLLDRFRLVRLPSQVYFLDYLPFAVEWREVGAVLGVAVAFTAACSLWGARRSAEMQPAEALRR